MFDWLLDKEQTEEDVAEEEEDEEEEEEGEVEKPVDEQTVFLNTEISECFALFDRKQTGTMESRYLKKALECLGISLTPFEIQELTEEMETNGVIHFDKFRDFAFEKLSNSDPVDSLKAAFQAFDSENEGVLSSDRLKKWLTTLGDPLTDKEAKELVKLGDPAGKGIVAYDDLIMILLKG